jgi:hypothetical protein
MGFATGGKTFFLWGGGVYDGIHSLFLDVNFFSRFALYKL